MYYALLAAAFILETGQTIVDLREEGWGLAAFALTAVLLVAKAFGAPVPLWAALAPAAAVIGFFVLVGPVAVLVAFLAIKAEDREATRP